jgi:hypothetical protein
MHSRTVATLTAASLFGLPAFAATDAGPAGDYCGKLTSSGRLVDAETRLEIGRDGRMSGVYRFRDGDTETGGKLQESKRGPGLTKMLRWTDKYGDGRLVITFDPTFGSFEGHWGPGDAMPDLTWTGALCGEPNS